MCRLRSKRGEISEFGSHENNSSWKYLAVGAELEFEKLVPELASVACVIPHIEVVTRHGEWRGVATEER
jgi:hypothetical protein